MRVSSASEEWFEREMISLSTCLGHKVGDENGVFFKIITFEIDKKIWVESTSDICYSIHKNWLLFFWKSSSCHQLLLTCFHTSPSSSNQTHPTLLLPLPAKYFIPSHHFFLYLLHSFYKNTFFILQSTTLMTHFIVFLFLLPARTLQYVFSLIHCSNEHSSQWNFCPNACRLQVRLEKKNNYKFFFKNFKKSLKNTKFI